MSYTWGLMPIIWGLRRLRQEDSCKFETSLSDTVSFRLAGPQDKTCLKKRKKKKKKRADEMAQWVEGLAAR